MMTTKMMESGGSLFLVFFLLGAFLTQGIRSAHVEVEPREALVLPGQNVSVMCRVGVPLQYCRVEIPGMKALNLNNKVQLREVSYYGAGLQAGQCGFTINSVTDSMNGAIKCSLGIETELTESEGYMQLIIARAPRAPELDLSRGTDSVRIYKVNDMLQASCVVKDGRPVANISWFLDDEPLYREGLSMPTVVDLAKENLQSKIQNLTRVLQPSDNGKHLRCLAFHPAYPNGVSETKRQLDVKYGPLPQFELDKFGYVVGQPGTIAVEVEANPKPQIEWDVGSERIKEGMNDQTGRLEAEPVHDLGNGRYEVSLRIAAIRQEDTTKQYVLRAYNDLGSQDYHIRISTKPEPQGVELGIGGIIGIIVAICFLVLVVFLLIFAKVTGRWCFSGQRDTRNIGETSDTESADVRPRGPNGTHSPFIKLTQFFKKNKEKEFTNEDDNEVERDDASPDEVKIPLDTTEDVQDGGDSDNKESKDGARKDPKQAAGLVYAELDLLSPAVGKPVVKNEDEKTEYAEIVYNTPEEAEEKEKEKQKKSES